MHPRAIIKVRDLDELKEEITTAVHVTREKTTEEKVFVTKANSTRAKDGYRYLDRCFKSLGIGHGGAKCTGPDVVLYVCVDL